MKKQLIGAALSIIAGVGLIASGLIHNDNEQVAAGVALIPVGGGFVVSLIRGLLAKNKLLEEAVAESQEATPPPVAKTAEEALKLRNRE